MCSTLNSGSARASSCPCLPYSGLAPALWLPQPDLVPALNWPCFSCPCSDLGLTLVWALSSAWLWPSTALILPLLALPLHHPCHAPPLPLNIPSSSLALALLDLPLVRPRSGSGLTLLCLNSFWLCSDLAPALLWPFSALVLPLLCLAHV